MLRRLKVDGSWPVYREAWELPATGTKS